MHKFVLVFLFFVVSSAVFAADTKPVNVYSVAPEKIGEYIAREQGKRRVVFIHTSWCPYCHKAMPGLFEIENARKGSVISISVDNTYGAYAKYAKKLGDAPFPLFYNTGSESNLAKVIGTKPWRGYPTMLLLNEKNEVVGDVNSMERIKKFLSIE